MSEKMDAYLARLQAAKKPRRDRAESMLALRRQGKKLREIGAQFGISKDRTRQILNWIYRLHRKEAGLPISGWSGKDRDAPLNH